MLWRRQRLHFIALAAITNNSEIYDTLTRQLKWYCSSSMISNGFIRIFVITRNIISWDENECISFTVLLASIHKYIHPTWIERATISIAISQTSARTTFIHTGVSWWTKQAKFYETKLPLTNSLDCHWWEWMPISFQASDSYPRIQKSRYRLLSFLRLTWPHVLQQPN